MTEGEHGELSEEGTKLSPKELFDFLSNARYEGPEKTAALTEMLGTRTVEEMAERESTLGVPDAVLDFLSLGEGLPIEVKIRLLTGAFRRAVERSHSIAGRYRQEAEKKQQLGSPEGRDQAFILTQLANNADNQAQEDQSILEVLEAE